MTLTKNLGVVKALFAQTTAPSNTQAIWLDTSLATPLHKAYNPTSGQWEAFIYLTLIDNDTIKKDGSGNLYVDNSALAAYAIADQSVTFQKMQNVASGTVFYRKSTGSGSPEAQTLAVLKSDLGLTGTNSGDQDLSIYVVKTLTINDKPLNANITLTPEDIGSPSGSGTSTGINTGDETGETILTKLGLSSIGGINTGDETYDSILDLFGLSGDGYTLITQELLDKIGSTPQSFSITLPSASTVSGRISAAVEGTDYPTGWVLSADGLNIEITHGLGRWIANVTVWAKTTGTQRQQLFNTAAYNGVTCLDDNTVKIFSLASILKDIVVYLTFE